MLKLNWILVYGAAAFLDLVGALTGAAGIGLVLNRFITFLAIPSFALYFYITGTKGWWRLAVGGTGEVIPVLGDFLPFWISTIWRIHKKNMKPKTADKEETTSEQTQEDQEFQPQEA